MAYSEKIMVCTVGFQKGVWFSTYDQKPSFFDLHLIRQQKRSNPLVKYKISNGLNLKQNELE